MVATMKLAMTLAFLMAVSGLTTMAWAIGFEASAVRALPWREIAMLAVPTASLTVLRLRSFLSNERD